MFPSLAQTAGNWFHLDPVYFYLLAPSAAIAWLTAYVFPNLYLLVNGKKANVLQVFISLVLILFFWNGTLTAVLADLMGVVFFFSGILFVLQFVKTVKWRYALGAGICLSIACNYRTAYQYGIYVFLLSLLIVKVQRLGGIKVLYVQLKHKREFPKKHAVGLLCMVIGFLLVAFPQYQINQAKGHNSFFPYDCEGAWVSGDNPADATLMESSANQSINVGYTGYPIVVADEQMFVIKDQLYARNDFLQVPQILGAYANSPLESLQYIAKKLLLAFDVKINASYPNSLPWNKTPGMVFSFLNYFILISGCYIFCVGQDIKTQDRLLMLMTFLGLTLPQMFVHVEWRYFISMYFLLYYFFAYHFVGSYATENGQLLKRKNYLVVLTISLFLCFVTSFGIYY